MRPKMSSLVDQTEKFQFVEPSPSVLKHSSLLHNIFRMSLKPCKGSTLSALFPPHRKLSGAYRMHHGCSSLATVLLFLLCTSSLLVGASLRHSSSSLLNLIGLQQSPAVASFGPSSGAASLSTSSQSLLSSTSSNAKLLNGFSSSMHNLKGQSGTSQSLDDEPQRWHTVSAFVGGEVSLPCAIDVVHCGRVYFITWTKNGSTTYSQVLSPVPTTSTASASKPNIKPKSNGDWQRVFIHSESFESVLGDLEANGPAGRVSFGPKEKMNATNFVFLTVKSVTANDEGVYKCDVTYVKGKCPSLTYTRVQTLVKPSPPKIRVNGKLLSEYRSSDDSSSANPKSSSDIELLRHRQIGPFEEGSTIVFECSTVGGRPMPELRWYNGSRPLRSKLNIIESGGSGDLRGVTDTPDYLMNDILEGSALKELKGGKSGSPKRELLVATTRIIASRYDLGAKFECRVLWNNSADYEETAHWSMHHRAKGKGQLANASLLHEWLLLDIKVRPLGIKVESPRSAVVNGETVMLRCHVDGARPAANITWYNRSEVVLAEALPTPHGSAVLNLSPKEAVVGLGQPARTRVTTELMTDGTYKSSSILVFSATRNDHQADFFCKGSNEVLRNRNEVPLLQGVQLQVLYPPIVAIEPDGVIPVNETSSVQLWCTFDANPANISEAIWFKDGEAIDFERWSTEKLWTSKDERGTPILTVNDIDRNDSAEYRCRVRNHLGVADSLTSAKLEVAYPPVVKLEILEPPSATVIEFSAVSATASLHSSNLVSFRCITTQGNPATLTQVFWYRNGHQFFTSISLKQLQQSQSSSSGSGHHFYRVGTGKHFTLVDDATSVGPVNGAFLRFNETAVAFQPVVQYLESPDILTITNVSRVHAGNYSCVGFNGAANASQRSAEKVLSVKYKPGQAVLSQNPAESYVLHGRQALLECTVNDAGNPRAHSIQWTLNGVRIDRPTEEPTILNAQVYGGRESGPLTARYRTAVADLSTAGQYACVAVNDLGEGQWGSFKLEVKSPPKLVVPLPASLGAQLNESISLVCAVECEPLCTIQWYHNNLTLLSPDSRGVFASSVRNELRAKLRNGNELAFWIETSEHQSSGVGSTYSVTESRLHVLNTSALFDHDQLSCLSAGNNLGKPAASTVVFRREFAPHSVHISQPQIDLLEGERYPEKPIQCSAFGNPPPNYYWTFSPFHSTDSTYSPPAAVNDNNVVAIGPMLTLNMTTMKGNVHHHSTKPDARVATESIELFGTVGSTLGPSLFRASRVQSGNYTCVASNRHGTFSTSMIINVFYRPECELRRIHTAKLFKQHSIPSSTFSNGSNALSSPSTHFDKENEASQVLISCSASSNPAPMSFSWFRRNGTSMTEIHPSPETDHSLFVAIQDYDYDEHDERIPVSVGQQMPYQADQTANSFSLGHTRSSAVLSVPEYAHLDEYACLVTNLIGKSEPCWFEDQPAQGRTQPEVSTWSWLSEENLFVVAATAGIAVFLVVASGAVVVVVCMHKHRTPSFKGFGTGSSSGSVSGTPQRFKLERPVPAHHLLDSSPDMDIDFVSGLDNRSKTATLTAGYRMVPGAAPNEPTQNGTLGKSYRTLPHHPNSYGPNGAVASGSVYGGSSSNGSNGGSRPFLVSYASSNVYAEPEYHCGASNHSGDQLTGSTTVTNASGTQLPGAGVLGLPPSSTYAIKDSDAPNVPKRISKYGSNQEIYENNYGPTYEELDQANSRYYYQPKVEQPLPMACKKPKKKSKKPKQRSNKFGYKSGESPSSSSLGSSSGEDHDEPENVNSNVDQIEETPSRRRPEFRSSYAASKLSARPSYALPQEPSSDSESTQSNSAAYNPERDFYYATGHLPSTEANTSKMYEALPPSGAATNARFRRMLPQSKYGSLVRQSSAGGGLPSVHSPATYRAYQHQPQQVQASPISTRIYFNFEGTSQGPPSVTQNPYNNSLRYGSPGVASHWSTAGRKRGSSPQGPMRTFNRASTQPNETLETQPDYHRVFNE